jgi:hypothetical protein
MSAGASRLPPVGSDKPLAEDLEPITVRSTVVLSQTTIGLALSTLEHLQLQDLRRKLCHSEFGIALTSCCPQAAQDTRFMKRAIAPISAMRRHPSFCL